MRASVRLGQRHALLRVEAHLAREPVDRQRVEARAEPQQQPPPPHVQVFVAPGDGRAQVLDRRRALGRRLPPLEARCSFVCFWQAAFCSYLPLFASINPAINHRQREGYTHTTSQSIPVCLRLGVGGGGAAGERRAGLLTHAFRIGPTPHAACEMPEIRRPGQKLSECSQLVGQLALSGEGNRLRTPIDVYHACWCRAARVGGV